LILPTRLEKRKKKKKKNKEDKKEEREFLVFEKGSGKGDYRKNVKLSSEERRKLFHQGFLSLHSE